MVENPSAPPGKATKYARIEYERRFLLAGIPDSRPLRRDAISDRYIAGTRLPLRRLVQLEPDAGGLAALLCEYGL